MKSGTFTNNTSFSVTAASVNVPTGTVQIDGIGVFTVPTGVTVIEVSQPDLGVAYVGVTPNTKHSLQLDWDMIRPQHYETYIRCNSHDVTYLSDYIVTDYDDQEPSLVFNVDWSPEINTHKPDVTDY